MLKDALFNDWELGSLYAIVVVAGSRQAALIGAVAPHVDDVASDTLLAHLVQGEKTGSGIVGFIPQGAVEFGGVAHALVDREPEVTWRQHQIFFAGGNGRGFEMFNHFRSNTPG